MAARMPAFVAADELSWSSTTARCAFGRTGFVPVDLPFLYALAAEFRDPEESTLERGKFTNVESDIVCMEDAAYGCKI